MGKIKKMSEFKPINYELDERITKELEEYILKKLQLLIGENDLKDYMDFFKLVTSNKYDGNWNKIIIEINEIFENEDNKIIPQILNFIQFDLNKQFNIIKNKYNIQDNN